MPSSTHFEVSFKRLLLLWMVVTVLVEAYVPHARWFCSGCQYSSSPASRFARFVKNRDWLKRPNEEIFIVRDDVEEKIADTNYKSFYTSKFADANVFFTKDVAEKVRYISEDLRGSVVTQSLAELEHTYGFSIHYLADFVCTGGVVPPVDTTRKISEFLTSNQLYELITALHSLDCADVNDGYDGPSVQDIANEHQVSISQVEGICKDNNILLPLGAETVLHSSLQQKLLTLLDEEINGINLN